MLPNWLLGKSKSKLQEILGGGGGGSDYTAGDGIDISNGVIAFDPATTPTIDPSKIDGLDDDLAALAPKTALSNANILHNPWFQVNQRDVTSTTTNGYFVDRWATYCAATGATTYTLNNDGTLTIDNSLGETEAYLEQRRTAKTISRITGRTITASVMLSDGTVRSGTGTYINTAGVIYYEDDDIQIHSQAQSHGKFFVFTVKAGKTVTIKAFKLELGSVSTLAMDTAPDMATELAKCQRYFQRINLPTHSMLLAGITTDTSNASLTFPLPEMRSTPTYTTSGIQYRSSSNSVLALTLNNVEMHKGGFICVNFRNGNHTSWQPIAIRAANDSGGYIDFDAEL